MRRQLGETLPVLMRIYPQLLPWHLDLLTYSELARLLEHAAEITAEREGTDG